MFLLTDFVVAFIIFFIMLLGLVIFCFRVSVDRKKEYFDWAKAVVDNLRGAHQGLEKDFDDLINRAKIGF